VSPKKKNIDPLFTMSRMLVVAGKGGVGKTTVTAAMARASADLGLRVLVVTIDSRQGLGDLLGGSSDAGSEYEGTLIASGLGPTKTGSILLRTLTASDALQDYLGTQGLARLAKRLVSSGVVDVVASAAPGIDDLLVLGKLKHLVGIAGPEGDHDLIIVDGPAAGHAISFLQSPAAMAKTISGGPLHSQANEVLAMLHNPEKCRVIMVTLPETTPVNELVETTALLTETVGVHFGPVVINGVDQAPEITALVAKDQLPEGELGDAARYRASRCAMHAHAVERVNQLVATGSISLPHIASAGLSASDIKTLAKVLLAEVSTQS
jgi:anion-transporting  ArsA/GET3 family ATPase